jgi:hypothetical protein
MEKGFAWILPPPAEAVPPKGEQPEAGQQGERPADAPSLLKH